MTETPDTPNGADADALVRPTAEGSVDPSAADGPGRQSPEYRKWRRRVFKRDGFACTRCGSRERIQAHHVKRWATHPDLRFEVANGLTLCYDCHQEEHRQMTLSESSAERYWDWNQTEAMWCDRATGERMDDYYDRTNDPAITAWLAEGW